MLSLVPGYPAVDRGQTGGNLTMRAAGVRETGGPVVPLDLPGPRDLRDGEILIQVQAAAAGNWDDIVRTGDWDTGTRPPMALGVAAAGLVAEAGRGVAGLVAGDRVAAASLPLRQQGTWAEWHIAAARDAAVLPPPLPPAAGAALAVPGLTAAQALAAVDAGPGRAVLVHGAGGVTGGLLVQLAVHAGAAVLATAGPASADRVRGLGAAEVLDYHDPGWPDRVRQVTGGGADAAVCAARGGAAATLTAVRDGGTLATITGDPPGRDRGIAVHDVYVTPDGALLRRLVGLLAAGTLTVRVAERFPFARAARALDRARRGGGGAAVVLEPHRPDLPPGR
jgi:NADPH:quinone reductase-like Zn-dependent oxidoreductase